MLLNMLPPEMLPLLSKELGVEITPGMGLITLIKKLREANPPRIIDIPASSEDLAMMQEVEDLYGDEVPVHQIAERPAPQKYRTLEVHDDHGRVIKVIRIPEE